VLVAHNGMHWLAAVLTSMAAQTTAFDEVVAVDTGSVDGSRDLLVKSLGPDRVLHASHATGFGQAVALAVESAQSRPDWLLILHDDAALAPNALERLLAAAAGNPSAGVLGCKAVAWTRSKLLVDVGMSLDRFGRAASILEPGEFDLGQFDESRSVFYVGTAAMLIRFDLYELLGGFDPRYFVYREDMDFCWRAHQSGADVIMVADALVHHALAMTVGRRRETVRPGSQRYYAERNTISSVIKNYGPMRLVFMLPMLMALGAAKILAFLLTRRAADALYCFGAWGWNLKALPSTIVARRRAQRIRRVADDHVSALMVHGVPRLRAYLEAVGSWLAGGGEEIPEEDAEELPPKRSGLIAALKAHPVMSFFVLSLVVLFISFRGLLGAGVLAGGGLVPFPGDAPAFLGPLYQSWHSVGLGSGASVSPALLPLGLLSLLAFGSGFLAGKISYLALLPLAGVSMWWASRLVVSSTGARLTASALYTFNPLSLAAFAQGRFGEMVFYALAPVCLAQLPRVLAVTRSGSDAVERWRPALRFAVILALALAFYPPSLWVIGGVGLPAVVVVSARSSPLERPMVARRVGELGLGTLGALALLLPWSIGFFRAGTPLLPGDPLLSSPGFAGLLQLRPGGPGMPGWLVGPVFPLVGIAALALVRVERRRLAAGLITIYLGATLWAFGATEWSGLRPVSWPGVLLVPGAVAVALLGALTADGLRESLSAHAFGWRQIVSAGLALVAALSAVLTAGHLLRGDWSPLATHRDERLPAFVAEEARTVGPFRVLWATPSGDRVRFAITTVDGGTLAETYIPVGRTSREVGAGVVGDILAGRTDKGGHLLGPLGVRYVVVRGTDDSSFVEDAIERQADLDPVGPGLGGLYINRAFLPRAAFLGVGQWALAARGESFRAATAGAGQALSIPAHAGSYSDNLPKGGGVLFLGESFDAAWKATAGGRALRHFRAFGWANGWEVPADVTRVEIRAAGGLTRKLLLVVQLMVFMGVTVVLARPKPAPQAAAEDEVEELEA